ncbi:hypothetical protein AVEN_37302-1 [Araneus ventricosus]|uniref:Secreted protein n=1 Tax=Araneus ventricosus TaxID=182803 RepID=A0A4Y2UBC9_ARAVE|nr:hypothetical protein AVEN_37302-1 [Araneus ventricosus]
MRVWHFLDLTLQMWSLLATRLQTRHNGKEKSRRNRRTKKMIGSNGTTWLREEELKKQTNKEIADCQPCLQHARTRLNVMRDKITIRYKTLCS